MLNNVLCCTILTNVTIVHLHWLMQWQWRLYIIKFWKRAPPLSNFLHFYADFGKNWPNKRLAPPVVDP